MVADDLVLDAQRVEVKRHREGTPEGIAVGVEVRANKNVGDAAQLLTKGRSQIASYAQATLRRVVGEVKALELYRYPRHDSKQLQPGGQIAC